jgi:methylated-DNA-[protein]-cysteine S-methyltransferase
MTWTTMTTPIGEILLAADDEGLTHLLMAPFDPPAGPRDDDDPILTRARAQLTAYFAGELTEFELPLHPAGTEFQRRVWDALTTIPYGRTASYGEIAAAIGAPGAARAVGLANGRNPISIIVPCHRVIGSGGALTGYGGGLDRKRYLLGLETGAQVLL